MSRTRPRGFAPWQPRAETLGLLNHVQAVLAEYKAHLPLTIRQVFYRLVGAHGYDKTEQAYARLCEVLNRPRRAGLIPFASIRDDGAVLRTPLGWDDVAHLARAVIHTAESFALDRQHGQPTRLLIAAEAAGMVPQIERVTAPYGIPVSSGGGFDSTTAKYDMAQLLGGWGSAEVLHIGDHDPSGVHLFASLAEDVRAMVGRGAGLRFTRLAVTPEQITAMRLPTAPAKPTDRRRFEGETVQAEAIPPDVLAELVRGAVRARIDAAAYAAVLDQEDTLRRRLTADLLPTLRRLALAP